MRKLIIAIAVLFSLSATAQKKDSLPSKHPEIITDSTGLISIKDYQAFIDQVVMDMPAKYADPIRQWWGTRLQAIIDKKRFK